MSLADSHLSIEALGARLRRRDARCIEITRFMLDRIRTHNPGINCFLEVFTDSALETAQARDRELERGANRGPLHGVPVAIKDIFDLPGHQASGGSRITRPALAAPPTVVRRLEAAGAIILGVLHLDELAAGGTGDNAHFGRCLNPWNPAHVCGGSSGGSAAAVAAGLAYAAIGSDAGGSIRIPAAFCGVVGVKPSYGRVSRAGALARTWSMDCIGPLTRGAADAALVLDAISGVDDFDPSTVPAPAVSRSRESFVRDRQAANWRSRSVGTCPGPAAECAVRSGAQASPK